jgi:hypothetical protein
MAQYSIGDAIKKMIEQSHWKHSYQVVKLREDWELIMGKTVAKHTNDLHIQQGKLFIYTNTAPLKNELNYNKPALIQRINEHFGENFITDVVIV